MHKRRENINPHTYLPFPKKNNESKNGHISASQIIRAVYLPEDTLDSFYTNATQLPPRYTLPRVSSGSLISIDSDKQNRG